MILHSDQEILPYGKMYRFCVFHANKKARLDKYLKEALTHLSRSRLQHFIEKGHVKVGGVIITDVSSTIHVRDEVEVFEEIQQEEAFTPEDIPLDIVYEDEALIVINKPRGLVVHPAAGNYSGTLVNALLYHCGESLKMAGDAKRPGIVHRLDKETSGLMVVAKTDEAHQKLTEQFQNRSISRTYQALVWGWPMPPKGRIESYIGRHPQHRQKMAVVKRGGKNAITHYQSLQSFCDGAISLVKCSLETGRTHQIRVHMHSLGYPLVGDPLYGHASAKMMKKLKNEVVGHIKSLKVQMLHAFKLQLIHPITGEEKIFESPLPDDMQGAIEILSDC